ncbi:MAG: TraR/DksA family transcriptional regulator [Pseudomonadales bacterium]
MDLAYYRAQLHQQLADLAALDDTASSAAEVVELDQTSVGRLSRMDALQGQAMAKASQQRRKQQVLAIKTALARLENGDFGLCVECDEQIALARLQHNPAVAMCLDCASRSEQ